MAHDVDVPRARSYGACQRPRVLDSDLSQHSLFGHIIHHDETILQSGDFLFHAAPPEKNEPRSNSTIAFVRLPIVKPTTVKPKNTRTTLKVSSGAAIWFSGPAPRVETVINVVWKELIWVFSGMR